MVEKTISLEREYIVPLRNEWLKVEYYKRTQKAAKTIKQFIAKHMKIEDRDISKVKLDVYLNHEIMFRGRKKPPAKVKVRAKKEGDIVRVELAELPAVHKFHKQKHERKHTKSAVKPSPPKEEPKKEAPVQSDEEKKKAEVEKEKAVAEQRALEAKQEAKAMKHTSQVKEPQIHRMALKK